MDAAGLPQGEVDSGVPSTPRDAGAVSDVADVGLTFDAGVSGPPPGCFGCRGVSGPDPSPWLLLALAVAGLGRVKRHRSSASLSAPLGRRLGDGSGMKLGDRSGLRQHDTGRAHQGIDAD